MIQYVLECIAFQLLFLVIYDLFLKRETFFQWNRVYLIGTHLLSILLPWVKIEALNTDIPGVTKFNEKYIFQLDEILLTPNTSRNSSFFSNVSIPSIVLLVGIFIALVLFFYKLYQIYTLHKQGTVYKLPNYNKVIVKESTIAFSFFKTIFLGDKVESKDYDTIIDHELVHIKQKHSIDLLFFELMRVIMWFNPLVYLYQNRITEVHEFIADSKVAKTNKKEQYQFLLSQVFQTQQISFINQFFKSSLIKKRIVMLQKSKSKKVLKFKYLVLVPLVLGMLLYTSCKTSAVKKEIVLTMVPFSKVEDAPVFPGCEDVINKRACFVEKFNRHVRKNFNYPQEAQEQGIQGRVNLLFRIDTDGNIKGLRMRGPDKILENEAERIISLLPQMKPGKHQGKLVEVGYSSPINFKLQ